MRGVNYYPRHAPWERFLTEGDLAEMAEELALIAGAGFNSLRIFLWYEPLFTCAPEEVRPQQAGSRVLLFTHRVQVIFCKLSKSLKLDAYAHHLSHITLTPVLASLG